ncbi:hypothetical protein, partial [Acinetobacter johnsonii]|uniref:hypothetical protein n=1 Tax=Acinetobacter johnsonii TaxID=40214 RepID=UPI0022E08E76
LKADIFTLEKPDISILELQSKFRITAIMLNGHKSILKLSMIILTFTSVLRLGWIEKGLTAIIAPETLQNRYLS